ncbi:MAG: hypothetical protein HKN62_14205 [Phycisphaerales bacterium]|nr:hypothetical protein [Phycisphaerales bacterium]
MSTLLVTIALTAAAATGSNELLDGGFETTSPRASLPTVTGAWGFDAAVATGPALGVEPLEGERMLQFLATGPLGAGGDGISADLWQLVDLAPHRELIAAGHAVARLQAGFNRVHLGPATDTQFTATLRAYDGTSARFAVSRTRVRASLSEARVTLETDDDPTTWETVTVLDRIPAGTAFLAVHIGALENRQNDLRAETLELHGHFADAVTLTIDTLCPADVDLDGGVGLMDLVRVLDEWGVCAPCSSDVDRDGVVGLSDVIAVMTAWGSCR